MERTDKASPITLHAVFGVICKLLEIIPGLEAALAAKETTLMRVRRSFRKSVWVPFKQALTYIRSNMRPVGSNPDDLR